MAEQELQKIIDVELTKEMKKSYIDYAMSVIVSRALPGRPGRAQARSPAYPIHNA